MCMACGAWAGNSLFHAPEGSVAEANALGSTVSDHTALFAGASWVSPFGVLDIKAQPTFVTYSFPTRMSDAARDEFGNAAKTWERFSEADRDLARKALDQWADASGLVFLEVPEDHGDIQFNWMDFNKVPGQAGSLAFAFYPFGIPISGTNDVERFNPLSGDVFMNLADRSGGALSSASTKLFVLLHEIGHALGFKHPFEATGANPRILKPELDNQAETVMSYTGDEPPELGPLDRAAVKAVYGGPGSDGAHLSSWKWSAASLTLTQTGKSGNDSIYGISVRDLISGRAGDDRLTGFAGNDRVMGGQGQDVVSGGDGADRLLGQEGTDRLVGGTGADWFVFDLLESGHADRIVDFGVGRDTIVLDQEAFAGLPLGRLSPGAFVTGAAAVDADGRIIYNGRTGELLFDPDGTGAEPAVKFAVLDRHLDLRGADFFVA